MKDPRLIAAATALLLLCGAGGQPAQSRSVKEDLQQIQREIQTRLRQGARTETALAAELDRLDMLLMQHWDEKTDEVAEILLIKAELYAGPLRQPETAISLLERLRFSFPRTAPATEADALIASLKRTAQSGSTAAPASRAEREHSRVEAETGLAVGQKFPDFNELDLDGQPLSVSMYRGKVVLIDFWATWCVPCVAEMPNVRRAYDTYHDQGFEVIGVSLDKDREKLLNYISRRGIPWPQYFDGRGWSNKLSQRCEIRGIPATFLLDRNGIIIGINLRWGALERAVAKAVSQQ
jgi:peroxiredoxin